MRHIFTIITFLCLSLTISATTYTVKTVPNVHVHDRSCFLTNPDGIISPEMQKKIDSVLSQIWKETSVEAVVVVLDDIDPQDYDTFATDLFMDWGIGKSDNDNGLLILVVKDMRKAVIRTGYGVEGSLPDIISSRILREEMFPRFKEGDYDGGLYNAVSRIRDILSDPSLKEELLSKYENDAESDTLSTEEVIYIYLGWCAFLLLMSLILLAFNYHDNKNKSRSVRYNNLLEMKTASLILSFLGLGIPLLTYFINRRLMKKVRNEPIWCDHCQTKMELLPKREGLMRLNPVQTTESHIGAVEYDAWQCPRCHDVKLVEYNGSNHFEKCPNCGARAEAFIGDKVISSPTYYTTGKGVHQYICRHCGKVTAVAFILPMLIRTSSGGGGGTGFGGGGFRGGSFGGGATGGGGASGGW